MRIYFKPKFIVIVNIFFLFISFLTKQKLNKKDSVLDSSYNNTRKTSYLYRYHFLFHLHNTVYLSIPRSCKDLRLGQIPCSSN